MVLFPFLFLLPLFFSSSFLSFPIDFGLSYVSDATIEVLHKKKDRT